MSTVRLSSFAIYKSEKRPEKPSDIEIIAGASEARFNTEGKLELVMASVPPRSAAMAKYMPTGGLLMLYGLRDSAQELQRVIAETRQLGAHFAFANIEVDIRHLENGLVDREFLHDAVRGIEPEVCQDRDDKHRGIDIANPIRFLNVRRMKSTLQLEILEKFSEYSDGPNSNQTTVKQVSQIATRPDLWDRLLSEDEDLKYLDVLVIPVADDPAVPGNMRQVAYVRPGIRIKSIVQGSEDVTLVLPDWMSPNILKSKL